MKLLSHILSPLNHSFLSREGGYCEAVRVRQVKWARVKVPINSSSYLCQRQAPQPVTRQFGPDRWAIKKAKGKKNERGEPLLPRGPQTEGAAKDSTYGQSPCLGRRTRGRGIFPEAALDVFLGQVRGCKSWG